MSYPDWTVTLILMFPLAAAANEKDIRDFDPLFDSHEVVRVTVDAPFKMLTSDRPDEEEVPGIFRVTTKDGSVLELDVAVRTRGNNRRDKDICKFPPMRLNFKKSQTKGALFHKQDKLKLVTHCASRSASFEQALIKEYLAYRILNLLTDASFRVRLLRITYVYTDDNRSVESYGILIEHKDRLSKRIDATPVAVENVRVSDLRPQDLNLASVFQYFLANTDFSPVATAPDEECCHNQALFAPDDGLHYTIPYDFDRSGWVDAPYATPNPRFGLRSVRERLYRGRCVNNEYLDASLALFRAHRAAIEALVVEQPELSKTSRKKLLRFSGQFYKTIDNPKKLNKTIVKSCI